MNIQTYLKNLENDVKKAYEIANEARAKGLDPADKVEIPLAMTMAEKVVGLVSAVYPQVEGTGIAKRIIELEKEYGKMNMAVSFKIAEEIAKQKFCQFESFLKAIEAGIRVGFAYYTLGVVASPIEGFTELKLGQTHDGKEYFKAYFSGPIRSAGTTASCMVLMLIDYLREMFGYEKYDPTEEEVKRCFVENVDYHERVANLQYFPTEEEMIFLAKNLPIQIAGEPTERIEVSNYKNLPRIETNCIRGGMCLIFSEGLAQKASKGFRLLKGVKDKGFKTTGFDFLEQYIKLHEKREKGKVEESPTYINDLVAGRPVFGHPSRSGAFRFRYGRARNNGFSAVSIHPATMAITDNFLATGTQIKTEKPIKGAVTTVCDSIDGPIVKLFNGSVRKLTSMDDAKKYYPDVEEIIYLGDILFSFGDVANRNSKLLKSAYVEEWWKLDLREKDAELEKKIDLFKVNFDEAVEISQKIGIPLHPKFIYYWREISAEEFGDLIDWLRNSRISRKIILPYSKKDQEKFAKGKRALELLGVEHEVTIEHVVLTKETSKSLLANLGLDFKIIDSGEELFLKDFFDDKQYAVEEGIISAINKVSSFIIKDKSGDFIGTRMGRPEKAKLRKLTGSPNVLFPVGQEGGRLRSVQEACSVGKVKSHFPIFYCEKCKKETIYSCCEDCGEKARKQFFFFETKEKSFNKQDEIGEKTGTPFCFQSIDIKYHLDKAMEKLGLNKDELPLLIKGVRGTSSEEHSIEHLAKGILRARHNLQVNKDGTIRFDVTELPLTAFKPKEISVGIGKLKELGYTTDVYGKELVSDEQILELMPHDILLPSSSESPDERADDVFFRVCNFIDEELELLYGLKPMYSLKNREDIVGQLGVCMAPHNCAGVICRFIGFSNVLGLYASPYMHAAVRRDCDGDEAAIMLLGDVLLNFSRKFLPSHRGGTQDAPLVLNAKIDAGEVDDQILDFECVSEYPIELYRLSEIGAHSSEVKIENIKKRLALGIDPFTNLWFTHDTTNFNKGVTCSSYKTLATMQEKVQHQMGLVEKIRAVDTSDVARLILERHFIRDMKGNLRNFSTQSFRCVGCNEIVRRPPLSGVCPSCNGKLIFTVHEGGIKKYLEPALDLAKKYNLSTYMIQNLELTKRFIDSIFGKEKEKQKALNDFF
jgi:DNA polymerase II large subunit